MRVFAARMLKVDCRWQVVTLEPHEMKRGRFLVPQERHERESVEICLAMKLAFQVRAECCSSRGGAQCPITRRTIVRIT